MTRQTSRLLFVFALAVVALKAMRRVVAELLWLNEPTLVAAIVAFYATPCLPRRPKWGAIGVILSIVAIEFLAVPMRGWPWAPGQTSHVLANTVATTGFAVLATAMLVSLAQVFGGWMETSYPRNSLSQEV